MVERFKAHAWKACVPQKGTEGSNPSPTAWKICLWQIVQSSKLKVQNAKPKVKIQNQNLNEIQNPKI